MTRLKAFHAAAPSPQAWPVIKTHRRHVMIKGAQRRPRTKPGAFVAKASAKDFTENPHDGMRSGDSIRATVLEGGLPDIGPVDWAAVDGHFCTKFRDLAHGQRGWGSRIYSASALGPIT